MNDMKVKTPEDPELKRQQEAAAQEKVTTIQQRLSSDTDAALRRFGARQSLTSVVTGGSTPAARGATMTSNRSPLYDAIQRGYNR